MGNTAIAFSRFKVITGQLGPQTAPPLPRYVTPCAHGSLHRGPHEIVTLRKTYHRVAKSRIGIRTIANRQTGVNIAIIAAFFF